MSKNEIQQFIDDARAKNWDDGRITEALTTGGWAEAQVRAALDGLTVPVPPSHDNKVATAIHQHGPQRPSISALQAALQHILLWLFTGMSTAMISIVSFALFASNSDSYSSSDTLLTYVVLELISFVPFAFLYWRYVRQRRAQPELMTGRVWSIITIVLHSIGLIVATIGFVLVLVLVRTGNTTAGVIASLTIGIMDALVVTAYVLANFAKTPSSVLRRRYLNVFPVALFVLIAVLGVMALVKVGPLRADDQTMQDIATTVNKVHEYAGTHKRLPSSLAVLSGVPDGLSYRRLSTSNYEVCATFKADHGDGFDGGTAEDDSYVSSYDFAAGGPGYHCWEFSNSSLETGGQIFEPLNPRSANGLNSD